MRVILMFLFPVFMLMCGSTLLAQPREQLISVVVAPDHSNWQYRVGEQARFTITILKDKIPLKNAIVKYEVGPEKMDPTMKDSVTLKNGSTTISGGSIKAAGFLRCSVTAYYEGKEYSNAATAGFDVDKITPTVELPQDFNDFWDSCKNELSKVPIDSRMVLIPEKCTEKVNVYHVSFRNIGNSKMYGILCVPKKEGKYPALLHVPGAGIRPYDGDIRNAELGIITLDIGIHGIPVNMPNEVYNNLASGALNGYPYVNLDNRDRYYYKRVYLGCVRAVDFLESLSQLDATRIAVTGGSQGGALSIITAALDNRIKWLAAFYPALSDMTGYLEGRAGGWPHLFDKNNARYNVKKEKLETIRYFDVVNFARILKAEGFYGWGFNDNVCPPTSMHAAYNVIKAPKELHLVPETGHWTFPEQIEQSEEWLQKKLGVTPPVAKP